MQVKESLLIESLQLRPARHAITIPNCRLREASESHLSFFRIAFTSLATLVDEYNVQHDFMMPSLKKTRPRLSIMCLECVEFPAVNLISKYGPAHPPQSLVSFYLFQGSIKYPLE